MAHRYVSSFFSRPAFRPRLNRLCILLWLGLGPCAGATWAQHGGSGGPARLGHK